MLGMNVVSAVAASIAIVILSMSLDSYPYVCPEYLQEAPSPTCREIAVIPHVSAGPNQQGRVCLAPCRAPILQGEQF